METREQQNGILEGVIWKQLLFFFFPILIGTFFQQLYNTVDTVIVGQFAGKEALSSVGGSSSHIIDKHKDKAGKIDSDVKRGHCHQFNRRIHGAQNSRRRRYA